MNLEKHKITFTQLQTIKDNLKSNETQQRIYSFFEKSVSKMRLVSEYDIIKITGIGLKNYSMLINAVQKPNLPEDIRILVLDITKEIQKFNKLLTKVNDKVILSGARISRNTMSYILKQKEEMETDWVIINVNVHGEQKLTINKMISNGAQK